MASLVKRPFYQRWDTRVLEAFFQYGLRELPTSLYPEYEPNEDAKIPVTLATTKHQEVWTYLRPNYQGRGAHGQKVFNRQLTPDMSPGRPYSHPFYRPESAETFHKLPSVRPSVLYIMGEESTLSDAECQRDKVKLTGTGTGGSGGLAEGQVSDVILPGIGHLVPMEAPDATAQETANWLERVLTAWKIEEETFSQAHRSKPKTHHLQVDDDWLHYIGSIPGRENKVAGVKL